MKRNRKRTLLALCIAFWSFYMTMTNLPHLMISPFIPLIVLLFYEKNKSIALWSTFVLALFLDLISSHAHFGVLTLSYCLTTWLLSHYRPFFFEDAWSTFPLLSALYSATSTFLFFILLHIYNIGFPFSWTWLVTDLFLYSLFDALYAFLYFTIPLHFIPHRVSQGNSFIVNRRPH